MENQIYLLLNRWNELKMELTGLFESRNRAEASVPMNEGIELFYKFLFLSNYSEECFDEKSINTAKWKPVNVEDRLNFIKKKPNIYQSFIQLTELMNEQEKQFNKKMVITKGTKQNNA